MTTLAGLVCAVVGGVIAWAWLPQRKRIPALPTAWALSPRPVFNVTERRVYRKLQDAFPKHVVLPKLPLVRFCQPDVLTQVHYWHDLIGSTHVSYAVCSPNGKVLLVVDLANGRSRSRRSTQIKEAVLTACGVKHISCAADELPTASALQAMVPATGVAVPVVTAVRAAAAEVEVEVVESDAEIVEALATTRESPSNAVVATRAERSPEPHDANLFQDSFFTPDSRLDGFTDIDSRYGTSMLDADRPRSPSDVGYSIGADGITVEMHDVDPEMPDWPSLGGAAVFDDGPYPAGNHAAKAPRH